MKAAIYIRVSTLDQAQEGYSLPAQRKVLTDWCNSHDFDIYNIYADEGISGKDIIHRPAFQQMFSDAKKEKFNIILVWALSRFTRSVADLYRTWEELNKHKVNLISCTEAFDTSTTTGRAMMGILGVFAQMEREMTSERVALAARERAEQGKRTCSDVLGYRCYGKDSLQLYEPEAELVRLIFNKFILYEKYLPVADLMNAMGYKGRRGFPFRAEGIKRIVTNPIYIGFYQFKGELFQGNFEPIISQSLWKRAQRIVKKISAKRK